MRTVMEFTAREFRKKQSSGNYGPKMLTRVYSVYERVRSKLFPDWPPVNLMRRELLHPLMENDLELFFLPKGTNPKIEQAIDDAYMVHLWHYQMMKKHFPDGIQFMQGSMFLEVIARKHCKPAIPDIILRN